MKAIYKAILAAALSAPLLTGCIEDVTPTSGIIQTQLDGNPNALEALVWAVPGHMNKVGTITNTHFDIGYGGLMIIRDLQTADYVHSSLGANYDHFRQCEEVRGMGEDYRVQQFCWNWSYNHILAINKIIASIDPETTDATQRMWLASAYAWRAWTYLDLGRYYEALPTDVYQLDDLVLGLTVPIVTENTTEADNRKNPRVSHEEMVEFIIGDLDKAVAYFGEAADVPEGKVLPSLAVAYGLYARTYLWDASFQAEIKQDEAAAEAGYAEAKKYADLAISTCGGKPLTRDEWLSTTSGFNSPSNNSWMFCAQYVSEDTGAKAPNVSFCGWAAPEKTYGYACARLKCFPEIGAELYNRMSDRDWRKLAFRAPEGSGLYGQEAVISREFADVNFIQPYIGFKFRPGGGAMDNTAGAVVAYPLMRVEEMYFISLECEIRANLAAGKAAFESWMKTYRYPAYRCYANAEEDVIEELIFQKRVEFWGEGLSLFDIKRLDYPVVRYYDGTNFYNDMLLNTERRPAWMNYVITRQEIDSNTGIPKALNNPSPDGLYKVN